MRTGPRRGADRRLRPAAEPRHEAVHHRRLDAARIHVAQGAGRRKAGVRGDTVGDHRRRSPWHLDRRQPGSDERPGMTDSSRLPRVTAARPAPDASSAATRSFARSVGVAWRSCISPASRTSIATSRSRSSRASTRPPPTWRSGSCASLVSRARLNHPNIVTVLEYFEDDDVPYIAMEYVPRGSLATVRRPPVARSACGSHGRRACRTRPRRDARDRPPRSQAGEPDGHVRRPGQDRRLRHRQGDPERSYRGFPDRNGHNRRHTDVHGPGAGDGPGRRHLDRPLLGWRDGLGAGRRPYAVSRHRSADGDPHAPCKRADPADGRGQAGRGSAAVGVDRSTARQGRRKADSKPHRGVGRARRDRDHTARPALAAGCSAPQLYRDARHAEAADARAVSKARAPRRRRRSRRKASRTSLPRVPTRATSRSGGKPSPPRPSPSPRHRR